MTDMHTFDRGYLVDYRIIKKHWFRDDEVEIRITDGNQTLRFTTRAGVFTIVTDKPIDEPLLRKEKY